MKLLPLIPLCVVLLSSPSRGADPTGSLLPNGDFESGSSGGANAWPVGKGVTIEEESGNHFLRLQAMEPGLQVQAYRKIQLPAGLTKLDFSVKVRFEDITPGAQNWHVGSIVMHFLNSAGQPLKPDPAPLSFKGSSSGWMEKSAQLSVPEGAAFLVFLPALFQVTHGTLDLDDVVIAPAKS